MMEFIIVFCSSIGYSSLLQMIKKCYLPDPRIGILVYFDTVINCSLSIKGIFPGQDLDFKISFQFLVDYNSLNAPPPFP